MESWGDAMIEFHSLEKVVLTADEAAQYLALNSTRALERLVQSKRVCPLKLGKRLVYARIELDAMVVRELRQEKRLRGVDSEEEA